MLAAKPTIYPIADCNGAGKTTFAKEFLPSLCVVRFLNTDEIARGLSPLRPEVAAFKAGRLLFNELRVPIARGETFALESAGSLRRVRQRVKEGGHHVLAADIRRRFRRSIACRIVNTG